MEPYVQTRDLYRFKLALILGRGERLKDILKKFPTERKFKDASLDEIAEAISITNRDSSILKKLKNLDTTYDRLVTFKPNSACSKRPRAKRIMGIDTEYLKSDLDSVQYVVTDEMELLTSGFIFTNEDLAPAVSIEQAINFLRNLINQLNPDIIVGHNFNSDISILESAYGDSLPELYFYDDTMDLLENSQLANIIGGSSLSKAIKNVFKEKVIGLFNAYNDLPLFIEYGLKDAIYPIFLRDYIINGRFPQNEFILTLETIFKKVNRKILDNDKFKLSFDQN